jgi:hypothetical protein
MTPFDATTAVDLCKQARESRRCKECHGDGFQAYSDTTCGRGGAGGQMITTADCHRCKGQGWIGAPDMTAMADQLEAACAEVERLTLAHGNVLLELHQCAKERLETAVNLDEENTILTGEVMSLSSQLSTALHERDEARGECERLRYVVDAARKWRDTPHIPNSNHYAGDHDQCVEAKRAEDDFWESVDNIEKAG